MNSPDPLGIWTLQKAASPPSSADARWLRWHPSELDSCVRERERWPVATLSGEARDELRQANLAWGADGAALANIEALGQADARVVVTGQQPTLLGGPLLVVYKTLAAIELARQLARRHPNLRFVPVFWIAGEDHDFDEIRRVYWPGHAGQLEEYLIPETSAARGRMIGRLGTADTLASLLAQIEQSTLRTEFRPAVEQFIKDAYGGDANLEGGFARVLARLTAGTGLVMVSPRMEWLRRRGARILGREFDRPGASARCLIERGEQLQAAGIAPAFRRPSDSLNAFWIDGDARRYTLRMQDGEVLRTLAGSANEDAIGQPPLGQGELLRMLQSDPRQFSNNVVTRPLVQDSALPTVAQIVGPGEAAYLAQVEALYEDFGVFAPVRWPRPEVTLIETRVERQMTKHELTVEEVMERDVVELVELLLRRDLAQGSVGLVEAVQDRHVAELEALRLQIALNDPSVVSAFDKMSQMLQRGYAKIVERLLYLKGQDEDHLRQAMMVIGCSLHPAGAPQERRLNPLVPFAVNHGLDWVERLRGQIDYDFSAPMQVIYLSKIA